MYYFIVNPKAQSGRGAVVWNRIRRVRKDKGLPFESLFTEYAGHASVLAREAAERDDDDKIIVAMGGDGTISEVMDGIWDHEDTESAVPAAPSVKVPPGPSSVISPKRPSWMRSQSILISL